MSQVTLTLDALQQMLEEAARMGAERALTSAGRSVPDVEPPGFVTSAALAQVLGVNVKYVRENWRWLGGVPISNGSRSEKRYDLTTAKAAFAARRAQSEPLSDPNRTSATKRRRTASRSRRTSPTGRELTPSGIPMRPVRHR